MHGHVAVGSLALGEWGACTLPLAVAFPGEATFPVWGHFPGAQHAAGDLDSGLANCGGPKPTFFPIWVLVWGAGLA